MPMPYYKNFLNPQPMSSNNQPPFPFKAVCFPKEYRKHNLNMPNKGEVVTILSWCPECSSCGHYVVQEYMFDKDGVEQYIHKMHFIPYEPPYSNSVIKQLAEKALSVGDSVDQPVKQLVNN